MNVLIVTVRGQGDRPGDFVAAYWPEGTVLERRLDLVRLHSAFT